MIDNQAYEIEDNDSALNWHSVHIAIVKVNPLFADVSPMPLFQESVDEMTDVICFLKKNAVS